MKGLFSHIITFIIFISIVVSCSWKKTEYEYYEKGIVAIEWEQTDCDSIFYCTQYYRNGQKKVEGNAIHKKYPDGSWIEYYSDGAIKWRGVYERGKHFLPEGDSIKDWINKPQSLEVKGDFQEIEVGDTLCFRVTIQDVYEGCYSVTVCDENQKCHIVEKNTDEEDPFPYKLEITSDIIKTSEQGKTYIEIVIFFMNEDGEIVIPLNPHSWYDLELGSINSSRLIPE